VNQQQFHLKVDGRLGPESIRAINACDADRLYRDFARQARSRYETLARLGNNRKFLAKWLERLDNPIPQAKRKRWARHFI